MIPHHPWWVPAQAPIFGGLRQLVGQELRRAGEWRPDSEFLDPVAERVGMKVQDLRGAIRTLDSARCFEKSRENMLSFHLVQRGHWGGIGWAAVAGLAGRALGVVGFRVK